MILLSLRSAAGNTRGPVHTESLLRSLHRANLPRKRLTLQLRSDNGSVGLAAECPDSLRMLFVQELQDAYPGTNVRTISESDHNDDSRTWSLSLRLRPDVLSIRTYDSFLDETEMRQFADPVAGLLSAIRTGNSGRIRCQIALSFRPAPHWRQRSAIQIKEILNRKFPTLWLRDVYIRNATYHHSIYRWFAWFYAWLIRTKIDPPSEPSEKTSQALYECWLAATVTAPANASHIALKKLREIAGAFGRFNEGEVQFVASRPQRTESRPKGYGFLLSAQEIATLWHPMTHAADSVSRVQTSQFKEVEPPTVLSSKERMVGEMILGRVKFRQQRNQFGIVMDDLRRHLIAIGKTGCGKSTFLMNVVRQQIEANRGVILFDPHGQLADEVLNIIPKRRTNDVIYFDASDRIAPVGFNPMLGPPGTDPTLIADGVLTSFKNVFGFDAGSAPRLLHIFRNCLLSLIGTPHTSLQGVQRLLVDVSFRKTVVAQVSNEAVRNFWLTEFNRWNERDRTQYVASLQNKLGAFTSNEQLQRILNSDRKGIQLRQVMDESMILVCNLSKGTVGHDASTLLGSLLLSNLQIAAMSRANIPEAERTDCVVVIDEFHSYLSEGNSTMADALAESRKYRTSYVLSTQMLEQLDPATLAGVLGNCGSTLCMTVGPRDAEVLAELFGNGLTPEDLMRIPKYHAYLRLLIEGAPHTFSMTTLPPSRYIPNRGDVIRKVSRQRFGS